MPQVPYQPYPTATPSAQGTPSLRLATPGAAFGENIGQAIEGFGLGLERDSDKIYARAVALQDLNNETAAKNADIEASKKMGALSADFHTKLGTNAGPQALEKYIGDLHDVYQQTRAALPNDDARRKYDATAISFVNRETFNGSLHSGRQMKDAYEGSLAAAIDTKADGVFNASLYGDGTVGLDSTIRDVRGAAHNYAMSKGMTPEAAKEFEDKQASKVLSHLIAGTAQHQPQKASELLDRYGSQLHGDDIPRVQNTVQTRQNAVGSRIEVDKLLAPLMNLKGDESAPSYKELLTRVDAMAEKQQPGNAEYRMAAERHLKEQYNGIRFQQRQDDFENKQTIEGALLGLYSNGQRPQSVEEMRNFTGVGGAWDKLSNSQKRHYENVISDMVRRGDRVDPTASLQQRQFYLGMSHSDPNQFLNSDLFADPKLSNQDRKFLFNVKEQVFRKGESNPQLSHAMQLMGSDLRAAGYTAQQDKDAFYQFQGVMHDWLSKYLADNKKTPKDSEVIEAGRMLLQTQAVPHLEWLHKGGVFTTQSEPMFRDVPQEAIEAFKAQRKVLDPNAPELNDQQVIRTLATEKLKRFMQKPSSGEDDGR